MKQTLVDKQIFNSDTEIEIPKWTATKEAKAEIETQLVIVEKRAKNSYFFSNSVLLPFLLEAY